MDGAPWIDGHALAAALEARHLPGVAFAATQFTPNSREFAGQPCAGVRIMVTDRKKFRPTLTACAIAFELRQLFREKYHFEELAKMFQNDDALSALREAADPSDVERRWEPSVQQFQRERQQYLLYK